MSSTRQTLAPPEVVRAQLLGPDVAPVQTVWGGADQDGRAPLLVTVDHISSNIRLGRGVRSGPDPLAGVMVHLHEVRHPGLAALIDQACPTGGHLDGSVAVGLALDLWLPETDWQVRTTGRVVQHWLFTRLVLERRNPDLPVWPAWGVDPVPDTFAYGLAIEDPRRAGLYDLWWPRSAPAPVRCYQWTRETSVPPVPV